MRFFPLFALLACTSMQDPTLTEIYPTVEIAPGEVLEVAIYEGPGTLVSAECDSDEFSFAAFPDLALPPSFLPDGITATLSIAVSTYATIGAHCEITRPGGVDSVDVLLSR